LTAPTLHLRIVFPRNRWDNFEYVMLRRAVRKDSGTYPLCVRLMLGVLGMHNMTVGIWK